MFWLHVCLRHACNYNVYAHLVVVKGDGIIASRLDNNEAVVVLGRAKLQMRVNLEVDRDVGKHHHVVASTFSLIQGARQPL